MDIRPIKNEQDYDWALHEIERYFDNEPASGTPDADRFDVLSALIESYEEKHWPIEAPDPVDAIAFRMEQIGFTQTNLAELFGSKSRASEILSRTRPLTLQMVYKLYEVMRIPAEVLIRPYHLTGKEASEENEEQGRGAETSSHTRRRAANVSPIGRRAGTSTTSFSRPSGRTSS